MKLKPVKITCDSTCDLTKALYEQYGVEVTPLSVILGEEQHLDGVDVTDAQLFSYVEKNGILPKTSAVSIGCYEEVFRKWTEAGYAVIHINISSEFSSCYQNACIAAEMVGDVYPIDSRNLSSGSGHLAALAWELAQQGKEASEIAEILNEEKHKLNVSFIIQTLDYLHKGGRCSGVAVLGANLLKLRPEIVVEGGKMAVGRKYRGSAEKTIMDYLHGRLDPYAGQKIQRIFVTHSPMPQDILEKAVALVRTLQPEAEVIPTDAGCTICSHCGPCCIGVLFFAP